MLVVYVEIPGFAEDLTLTFRDVRVPRSSTATPVPNRLMVTPQYGKVHRFGPEGTVLDYARQRSATPNQGLLSASAYEWYSRNMYRPGSEPAYAAF